MISSARSSKSGLMPCSTLVTVVSVSLVREYSSPDPTVFGLHKCKVSASSAWLATPARARLANLYNPPLPAQTSIAWPYTFCWTWWSEVNLEQSSLTAYQLTSTENRFRIRCSTFSLHPASFFFALRHRVAVSAIIAARCFV